jgi:hypothetical protein
MSKEELWKKLDEVKRLADQALLKTRVEWLNRICREAKELGFGSLGELVAFMVDHACDIQLKEGAADESG